MARTPSAEYLILDIETVPDTERWVRPETAHGEPAFPPTWAHRIIVVGCLWLDHGYRLKRFGVIGDSGGGPHALACAALIPDRVERAACLSGVAPLGNSGFPGTYG